MHCFLKFCFVCLFVCLFFQNYVRLFWSYQKFTLAKPSFQVRTSSETQGQIVGARESLNGRKNMAQKKSKERPEEPLGTMTYQTSSKWSPPFWLLIGVRKTYVLPDQFQMVTVVPASDWCQKTCVFLAPIKSQNGSDHLELVW